MMRLLAIFLAMLCCLSVRADERILDFHSDIDIAADGSMTVAETISVNAEGRKIRRGIYRDFPTRYRDRYGNRVTVLFEPIDVLRDGQAEPWHSAELENGLRVYFGDAKVTLDRGQHTYVFRYRTTRQLGFFDDHDELYWNVTGNGWDFTIDSASATVTLPGRVDPSQIKVEGYIGEQGDKTKNDTTKVNDAGQAFISAMAALPPRSGLTVVVSFPKGIVAEPTTDQKLAWFAADNRREAVLGVGLLILVGFLYWQWRRVGVDPEGGVIIPQYDPPAEISPAAARYVRRMGYDDRCFAADMVDLGVRGAVTISQKRKSNFSITRSANPDPPLSDSGRILYEGLLGSRSSLEFTNANHTVIGATRANHTRFLNSHYADPHFKRNDGIAFLGVAISIAVIVAAFVFGRSSTTSSDIGLTVSLTISMHIVSALGYHAFRGWREGRRPIGLTIWSAVVGFGAVPLAMALMDETSVVFATIVILLAAVHTPCAYWMRAPTVKGRKALDHIEGLRHYLGVAERDDLARAKAPPMSVDEYQRLLPYALALDVEKTWGDQLADAIGPAAVAAAAAGMAWYAGDMSRGFNASNFGSSLGSSLSSAISSSSSAPGSSSGRGGGGSSGGGGGGGGGGGW